MNPARIVLHLMFVLVGVGTTMFGPLLPELSERWALNDATAGALFTSLFLSAVGGAVTVSVLLRRVGGWRLMVVGYVCTGVGALGLSSPYWQLGFAGSCLLGFGLGLVNPTANLAAASMWRGQPASALTVLNFFFSIGASLAPPLMGYIIARGATVWIPVVYASLTLLGALIAAQLRVSEYQASDSQPLPGQAGDVSGSTTQSNSPKLLPFVVASMAVLFLYVGVETSLGGWATTHLRRSTEASAFLAASAPSFYWLSLLLSRICAVALLPRVGMLAVLLAGAALSTIGGFLLPGFTVAGWALAALALAGFGLGPIFPTAVGYFLRYSGERGAALIGFLFAAGSIGGGVIPYAVGHVAETTGSLSNALFILPAVAGMMLMAMLAAAHTRPHA